MHINPNIKCHFCNGNHKCRDCPIEAMNAASNRRKVGTWFEEWVSCNIACPNCNGHLKVKGDHTPSLDLVCDNPKCMNKFECKSKCLSVNCLPKDIFLPHGTYNDFIQQINKGLNLKNKYIFLLQLNITKRLMSIINPFKEIILILALKDAHSKVQS